ncbi:MAG: BioY family protein [ANME-2 cluster archaeon HR1]|nr:MAG: BioY family protein [ANME-2 cluster archaeon HR1]
MTENAQVKPLIYASLFAALTAIGAFIRIPGPGPVPITLQIFFVILTGLVLGSRWGAISMIVYVMLGLIGLPVFSGGLSGIGVLLGPTGGYLIGFIIGAFVIGLISHSAKEGFTASVLAVVSGLFMIYLSGIVQLSVVLHISLWEAVVIGVLPFILFDIIKIAAALIIADKIRTIVVIP